MLQWRARDVLSLFCQPFGWWFSSKPIGDAEGPRGWALGKELRAIAQQTGDLQIALKPWGCFGLRSIYTGDIRFEPPALICPNL